MCSRRASYCCSFVYWCFSGLHWGPGRGPRLWCHNGDPQNAPFKSWAEISGPLAQPQHVGKIAPPREDLENGPRSRHGSGCCLCDAGEAPDLHFLPYFLSSCSFLAQVNSNNQSHCAYSCVVGPGLGPTENTKVSRLWPCQCDEAHRKVMKGDG